jgi:flagellin
MLQRMNELAVKAANGTNSASDRSAIQDEIDQLTTEIDRVSTTTKFNETYLLKGTNADGTAGKLTYNTAASNLSSITEFDAETGVAKIAVGQAAASTNGTTSFKATDIAVGSVTYKLIDVSTIKATSANVTAMSGNELAKALTSTTGSVKAYTSMESLMKDIRADNAADIKNVSASTSSAGSLSIKIEAFADLNNAADLSLHVGADSTDDNKISMNVANLSARGLGVNGLRVDGDTGVNATKAIDTIADALQRVSDQRAALGAIQNRLEHTIANLDNVVENTTSAESAIRDTDMATEMVKYSNNNILAQAGQAMLAQANQSNQGVLSLLG